VKHYPSPMLERLKNLGHTPRVSDDTWVIRCNVCGGTFYFGAAFDFMEIGDKPYDLMTCSEACIKDVIE